MNIRSSFFVALLFSIAPFALPAHAQEKSVPGEGEAVARVEPLDRFHEVIFPMWHDAWPKKDTEKLRALLPEVNEGIAAIVSAELPGILREKRKAWDLGVADLKAAGESYNAAAADKDPQALLGAAQMLHSRYEALARIRRPVLKEIEDFHVTLYTLYHYELPANAIRKIRLAAATLKTKMEVLNKAVLPERLRGKLDAFVVARASLGASMAALDSVLSTDDEAAIRNAVVTIHGKFETLNAVFD